MRVSLSQVPASVRRLAVQHLESLRGSDIDFNVDDLYLGDLACPIFRPDIEGVAYYEFEILKATREAPEARPDLAEGIVKVNLVGDQGYAKAYNSPFFPPALLEGRLRFRVARPLQGFITVSTGQHDFPVPHWSLQGLPISYELEEACVKAGACSRVRRVYKIDALCYAAEDEAGNRIATFGQQPSLIRGLPADLEALAGKITSLAPRSTGAADGRPDMPRMSVRPPLVKSGAKPVALHFDAWSDWPAFKRNFGAQFGPMLRQLRSRATAGAWAVDERVRKFGEGILAGVPHTVALLSSDFSLKVSGEGAALVRVRVLKRPGGGAAVELLCVRLPKRQELGFRLDVTYTDQTTESLLFFVYDREVASSKKSAPED